MSTEMIETLRSARCGIGLTYGMTETWGDLGFRVDCGACPLARVQHAKAPSGLENRDDSHENRDHPNVQHAKLRAHKRQALLAATEVNLAKIKARVDAAKLVGQDEIGLRVGKIVNQYKVAKHFELNIGEAAFSFERKPGSIAAEAALDGIYIIRTSVSADKMTAADCVRNYKSLANVERVPLIQGH
ncbi:hypothetical protein LP414_06855 [Polaromonas sp. P1(28)-13]|nr:hypothetical protein LP414_06855 [Polaromonas sp. P1(28)-13]